jgi:FixJ family two-component response regulator
VGFVATEPRIVAVVDDDESVRQALEGLLRSVGLPSEVFASAEEFLRSPHRSTTACVILDLRMPRMGGLALQEQLARDGDRIPIIILTAHGDGDTRRRALTAGAVAFMDKPCDDEALLGAVRAALRAADDKAGARAEPAAARRGVCSGDS